MGWVLGLGAGPGRGVWGAAEGTLPLLSPAPLYLQITATNSRKN